MTGKDGAEATALTGARGGKATAGTPPGEALALLPGQLPRGWQGAPSPPLRAGVPRPEPREPKWPGHLASKGQTHCASRGPGTRPGRSGRDPKRQAVTDPGGRREVTGLRISAGRAGAGAGLRGPQAAPPLAWPEGAAVPLSPRCCLHDRRPRVLALAQALGALLLASHALSRDGARSRGGGRRLRPSPALAPPQRGRPVCQGHVTRSPVQLSQHGSVPAPSGSLNLPCRFYVISHSFSFVFPSFLTFCIVLRVSVNTSQCGLHRRQPFVPALALGDGPPASRPSLAVAPLPISVTVASGEALAGCLQGT